MPGIGEVGGMTGCCAPGGNTGLPGCVAVTDGSDPAGAGCAVTEPEGTGCSEIGASGDGVTGAAAAPACGCAASGSAPPIVAGGPVNVILLCVPI